MGRVAAATSLAGGMLAFALPFGMVSSCDGPEVHFTGAELATFSVPAHSGSERELAREVEQSASPFAFVVLVAAAPGLGRLALRRAGACTWVALVAIQLAAIALLTAGDASDLLEGYYLSLLGLTLAGLSCLAGWIRSRRRRGASAWAPLAWGLAALAPPVGLAVSATRAAAVWVVRFVARRERARPASA